MQAIDKLIEQSEGFDERKQGLDFKVKPNELGWSPDGLHCEVTTDGGKMQLKLTDNAWDQVYRKLAPTVYGSSSSRKSLEKAYMEGIPGPLKAITCNILSATAHAKYPNRSWLVRGYEGEDTTTCRAILNGGYPAVANTDMLRMVGTWLEQSQAQLPNLRVATSQVTPDSLYLRTVWKEANRPNGNGGTASGYSVGVFIGNSEIGRGFIEVLPLVQKNICDNSIIFRVQAARTMQAAYGQLVDDDEEAEGEFIGLRLSHKGDVENIKYVVRVAINQAFGGSAEMLSKVFKAEQEQLPDFAAVLGGLAIKYGWDDETQGQVRVGTEGADTRMAVVNGVTFAAQLRDDPGERVAMEIEGGNLLMAPGSLFEEAAKRYYKAEAEVVAVGRRRA